MKTLDLEGVRAEHDAAAAELDLPQGVVFPGYRDGGVSAVYQEGCGLAQAQRYWRYAWIIEWLDQRGVDADREAKALDVLRNEVPQCRGMTTFADQSTRDWYSHCPSLATMGDPSGFQQTIDANQPEIVREGQQ